MLGLVAKSWKGDTKRAPKKGFLGQIFKRFDVKVDVLHVAAVWLKFVG